MGRDGMDSVVDRIKKARRAAHEFFGKYLYAQREKTHVVSCPNCENDLYIIKTKHGQIRGQCKTNQCCSWME